MQALGSLRGVIARDVAGRIAAHSVAFSSTALQEASRAATPSWRAVLACAAAGGAAAVLAHAHSEPTGTTAARFPPDEYHAPLYDIIAASEPKEPDLWDRWGQVKRFLWSWRRRAPTDVPLPTDKLACHVPPGAYSPDTYQPVVLVSCGSFNPPTYMHLRMLELARQALTARGKDVVGAYLSPVNDAYWKKALAPGRHRVAMCQAAAKDSEFIMVDPWEVEQRDYTRTLFVLQRVRRKLDQLFNQQPGHHGGTTLGAAPQGCPPKAPKVVLVCGADVVESMADPSIWRQDLLEQLLTEHGVVCISRDGAGVAAGAQLEQPGTLLNRHQANVLLVQDPVPNEVSSSAVRHELEQGRSVKYLLPDAVIEYVHRHGLYGVGGERHKSGWMGSWGGSKVDKEQDS